MGLCGKCKVIRTKDEQMQQMLVEQALPCDVRATASGNPAQPSRRPARGVMVNLAESPLGWLKVRGKISDRQFAAGETLRQDYERAQLGPRVTMCWNGAPLDGNRRGPRDPAAATDGMIAAKARFMAAIDQAGPGLSDILWRVICAGEALPFAEKRLGWPTRAGRLVLTLALDRVADYYHIR
jgi:hypothetical protein